MTDDRGRLAAVREAAQQRDLFVQIIESLPDGLVIVDQKGVIVFVNRQSELMFGYPRAELVGVEHNVLLPEALREKHDQHRIDYQSDPHVRAMGILGTPLMGRRKNGVEFEIDIMLAPIVVEAGVYTVAVVRRKR